MEAKRSNHHLSPMRCPGQLDDVDLFSPGAQEHWYEAYDILHDEAPVHRIPGEGFEPGTDAFILCKHEDIALVVRNQQRFPVVNSLFVRQLAEAGGDPAEIPNISAILASMATLRPNPELWRAHRQELTDPWVGPGAGRNRPMIERVANELVDKWIERGAVEFVSEFAQPLPHTVMANVLGWPLADLKLLKYFGDGTVKPFVYGRGHNNILSQEETASQFEVLEEFKQYTADLIREKRKNPQEPARRHDLLPYRSGVLTAGAQAQGPGNQRNRLCNGHRRAGNNPVRAGGRGAVADRKRRHLGRTES